MRLSLFFVLFVKLLLVAAASQTSSLSVPCAPLIDYIEPDSQRNLEIFLGGGAILDDGPIFFDLPSLQISAISPQVKLCIENITMPTSVGGSDCGDWLKCWLVTGIFPITDTDPKQDSHCACVGSELGSGSVDNDVSLSDRCVNRKPIYDTWGASCPAVETVNGRYDNNYSTVQVNLCPEFKGTFVDDNCDVCSRGGQHPQVKIGLQWINKAEQCYNDPPFSAGSMMRISNLTTIVVAGVSLLVLSSIL